MKEFLKRFLPMSAKSTNARLLEIQAQIDAQQNAILKQIQQISETLESTASATKSVVQAVQLREKQVSQLEDSLCGLEQRQQQMVEQIENTPALLNQELTGLNEQLQRAAEEVHDIRTGDLFRRIEFVQGKQILLESTLQRNLLSMEDQKRSAEYQFISRMRSLFPVQQVVSEKDFVRIGRNRDGGYLMLDDFSERNVAYSIGIADDVSWDQGMVDRGFDVYMYDHTIDSLPYENEKFHYFKNGLGAKADPATPLLKTLQQLMTENGHMDRYGMIFKIDIEGAEWDFLNEVDAELLSHFSQIVFEFHNLIFSQYEDRIKTAMEKLNKTHQLVHLHPNNYGGYLQIGGKVLPELIEGTYLLRSEYSFTKEPLTFPTAQDEISCNYLPDIYLGSWDTEK